MLSLWMLSIVLLGAKASPLTDKQQTSHSLAEEDVADFEEVLEEVESRERALEEELLDTLLEEERLLGKTDLTSTDSAKFITNSNVEGEKYYSHSDINCRYMLERNASCILFEK